jgi:hypothetical protein
MSLDYKQVTHLINMSSLNWYYKLINELTELTRKPVFAKHVVYFSKPRKYLKAHACLQASLMLKLGSGRIFLCFF